MGGVRCAWCGSSDFGGMIEISRKRGVPHRQPACKHHYERLKPKEEVKPKRAPNWKTMKNYDGKDR